MVKVIVEKFLYIFFYCIKAIGFYLQVFAQSTLKSDFIVEKEKPNMKELKPIL